MWTRISSAEIPRVYLEATDGFIRGSLRMVARAAQERGTDLPARTRTVAIRALVHHSSVLVELCAACFRSLGGTGFARPVASRDAPH